MCGIAGFVNPGGRECAAADLDLLRAMNDLLVHRGPDDAGDVMLGPAALAMRRLAVIDLRSGHQPMCTPDGRFAIVLNGELYNYRELRPRLEERGAVFRTHSDTEVALWAYALDGPACLAAIRGMYAFAIWDRASRSLFLARDRAGEKPLYYQPLEAGGLVFASEVKALIRHPAVRTEIDPAALDAFLTFGYVPDPLCIFRGVRKLPPAHYLLLAAGQVTVTPYWALVPRDSGPADPALVRRDLETTLERAVASQLVADVPLGAFLSGGVDSSAVVAAATRARREPVMTFSVSFLDAAFDEGPYARRVAEHLGTEHYEFRLSPKVGALVEAVAWHFDEPFADSSALPTLLVSLAARQKVTVALSGDGGDELFGGYDRYALELGRARWDVVPAGLRRALLGGVARRLPYGAYGRNYLDNLSRSGLQRYLHSISLFSEVDRSRYFEPLGSAPDALAAARWFDDDTSAMPLLTKMSLADWHTYLPGDILVKVDRASMAASLETRAPFLAPEVAELAMRIPASMKLRGFEGKAILRDTVRPWLPAGVLDRPKRGFGVPLVRWFREELREAVYETLTRRNGILADLVDREYVDILWNEHQSRRRDHSTRLWAMFVLSRWHQHLQSGAWRSRETAPRIDAQSILAELEVGGAACGRT